MTDTVTVKASPLALSLHQLQLMFEGCDLEQLDQYLIASNGDLSVACDLALAKESKVQTKKEKEEKPNIAATAQKNIKDFTNRFNTRMKQLFATDNSNPVYEELFKEEQLQEHTKFCVAGKERDDIDDFWGIADGSDLHHPVAKPASCYPIDFGDVILTALSPPTSDTSNPIEDSQMVANTFGIGTPPRHRNKTPISVSPPHVSPPKIDVSPPTVSSTNPTATGVSTGLPTGVSLIVPPDVSTGVCHGIPPGVSPAVSTENKENGKGDQSDLLSFG